MVPLHSPLAGDLLGHHNDVVSIRDGKKILLGTSTERTACYHG